MRRKRKKPEIRLLLICLVLLSASPCLKAQESISGREVIAEAARLEDEGKSAEAAGLCRQWLARNTGSDQLFSVLVQALKLESGAESALSLLETYTPAVRNLQDRHTLLYNRALILEMLGRLEEAQALYAELPAYGQVLYKRALLLFEQGDAAEAEKHLLAVEAEVEDKEIRARALHLRARLYLATNREAEAEGTYEQLRREYGDVSGAPVFLLAYFEYLLAAGRREEARDLLADLETRYPASPEYRLARGGWEAESPEEREDADIRYAPAPWRLLAPLDGGGGWDAAGGDPRPEAPQPEAAQLPRERPQAEQQPQEAPPEPQAPETVEPPPEVLVQAGSFSVAENAHYLQRDLTARGFAARVAEVSLAGKIYYRVLVGPAGGVEAAQQLLLRLKDAGFEGVMLWSED